MIGLAPRVFVPLCFCWSYVSAFSFISLTTENLHKQCLVPLAHIASHIPVISPREYIGNLRAPSLFSERMMLYLSLMLTKSSDYFECYSRSHDHGRWDLCSPLFSNQTQFCHQIPLFSIIVKGLRSWVQCFTIWQIHFLWKQLLNSSHSCNFYLGKFIKNVKRFVFDLFSYSTARLTPYWAFCSVRCCCCC